MKKILLMMTILSTLNIVNAAEGAKVGEGAGSCDDVVNCASGNCKSTTASDSSEKKDEATSKGKSK
ncbi:hypothetical protein [Bacteriovorax sp. Seq25_V]|uniref:hypothetical protein n=1 Tax=Bacteriovorax sp. Seq25_V TaxID=1201288 RepID=UPI00038A1B9E|nr:hypothetical protein [Bacteriovorax sp. Seq25_V]EQC43495.1 hypothetical protein M900_0247 [Bacteriovorax sp. Seq25_V]